MAQADRMVVLILSTDDPSALARRLAAALAPAPAAPEKGGRPPFGFRRGTQGMEPHPDEAGVLRCIYRLADQGVGAAEIARAVVAAFPWLAERWGDPGSRWRRVATALRTRSEHEPLLPTTV